MGFVVMFSGALRKCHMMLTRLDTPSKVWSFLGKEATLITDYWLHGAQEPELGYLLRSFLHWSSHPAALLFSPCTGDPTRVPISWLPYPYLIKAPVPVLIPSPAVLCFFPALWLLLTLCPQQQLLFCPTHNAHPAECPSPVEQVTHGTGGAVLAQEGLCWPTSPQGCPELPTGQGPGLAWCCWARCWPSGTPGDPWWPSVTCGVTCRVTCSHGHGVPWALALLGIPSSSPAKWGAWYAAQTCSHYCPAVDLGTGSYFCQMINGVGDCCCFVSSDMGLNICQTREPLFRLYYLRREYINPAEAVKIHSSIIICLIFEKCLLWNYLKKNFCVSVFYSGYL